MKQLWYRPSSEARKAVKLSPAISDALAVLVDEIKAVGDQRIAAATTPGQQDRAARQAGAMVDRLAWVASYLEGRPGRRDPAWWYCGTCGRPYHGAPVFCAACSECGAHQFRRGDEIAESEATAAGILDIEAA